MFNIGPGELMAILAVALIVLGPTRLPQAVRTVGRVVGELRRISSGFQDELRNAFDDTDVIDQIEKGPTATPATTTTSTGSTGSTAEVPDTPVVDTTGTLVDDDAGDDDAGDDDAGDDEARDEPVDDGDTDSGGVDTAAMGLASAAPTEPAAGAEQRGDDVVDEIEKIDDDPPETDQRAAS